MVASELPLRYIARAFGKSLLTRRRRLNIELLVWPAFEAHITTSTLPEHQDRKTLTELGVTASSSSGLLQQSRSVVRASRACSEKHVCDVWTKYDGEVVGDSAIDNYQQEGEEAALFVGEIPEEDQSCAISGCVSSRHTYGRASGSCSALTCSNEKIISPCRFVAGRTYTSCPFRVLYILSLIGLGDTDW